MKNNLNKNLNKGKKINSKANNKNKNNSKSNSKKVNKKEVSSKNSNKSSNKLANKVCKNQKIASKKALKDVVANSLLNPTQSFYKDSVYSEESSSRKRCSKLDKTKVSTRYNRATVKAQSKNLKDTVVSKDNKSSCHTISSNNNLNNHSNHNNFSGIKILLSLTLMLLFAGGAYLSMNKEQNFFHFSFVKSEQIDSELNQETVRGNLIIDNSIKEKENTNNVDSSLSSLGSNQKQDIKSSKNSLNKKVVKQHKTNKVLKNKNKKR